jgi:hypothetical protein
MSGICAYCGKPGVLNKDENGRYRRYHAHCEAEMNRIRSEKKKVGAP